MNPTPQQKQAIFNQLSGMTYSNVEDAVSQLNAKNIDNPLPQQTVPKQYNWIQLVGAIHPDRIRTIMTLPTTITLIEQINNKDVTALTYWINALHVAGYILDEDVANINAITTATELDPNYQSKVSWSYIHLGRNVDGFDVMEALNGSS